ncbi:MAG: HutD family protein [Gemmatimonadaceae bacterium]
MRVLRADEYRRMPWRNGGGETAEVAIGPAGATVENFDWRVSMAHIEADGPFSIFAGTDRTLMILRGNGIKLSIAEGAPLDLTRESQPFAFSGDVSAHATLPGGAVTDLNVMTKRARRSHTVRRLAVHRRIELTVDAPLALLVCAEGELQIEMPDGGKTSAVELMALDALLLEDEPDTLSIITHGSALVYLIEFREGIANR